MEYQIPSLAALDAVVAQVLEASGTRRKLLFYGEIGAGKTTFIKAFCRALGVQDTVTSPTFSLVNEYHYAIADAPAGKVFHIDLYRLDSLQEALDIGIEDYLYDDSYCLIEWAELLEPILPSEVVRIHISPMEDSSRKLVLL